jgi:hypothetical protein
MYSVVDIGLSDPIDEAASAEKIAHRLRYARELQVDASFA